MSLRSIYRSPKGEDEIHAIYDRQLARLNLPYESRMVNTSFGATHVLMLGPKTASPVVVLQGGNTTSPLTLSWLRPLIRKYRIYAPDTIGHPGKSASIRLSPRGNSYGRWVVDVLDALNLQNPSFIGGSYGAGILLHTAVYAPERISKAVLFIPSGLVSIPASTMLYWIWWLSLYKINPTTQKLKRILSPMFQNEAIDEDVLEISEAVFRLVHIEPEMPRNVMPEELVNFTAPTLVIAAERDRLFPGIAIAKRAHDLFPNLIATKIIAGATHYMAARYHAHLNEYCERFLEGKTI